LGTTQSKELQDCGEKRKRGTKGNENGGNHLFTKKTTSEEEYRRGGKTTKSGVKMGTGGPVYGATKIRNSWELTISSRKNKASYPEKKKKRGTEKV